MNESSRRKLLQRLEKLVVNAAAPTPPESGRFHVAMTEEASFAFVGTWADYYAETVRSIADDRGWGAKFSEKFIRGQLRQIVARTLRDGETTNMGNYFAEMAAEFDAYNTEQTVYLPVVGIEMGTEELPLGNVTFRLMDDSATDAIIARAAAIIATTKHTEEEKRIFQQLREQEYNERLRGKVCAVFRAVAEPDRAKERAVDETRRALELLRYAAAMLYPTDKYPALGIAGEVVETPRYMFTFSERGATHGGKFVAGVQTFAVTERQRKNLEVLGVFALSGVLRKSQTTKFEQTLLNAVHWFANAQVQPEAENRLLSLVTCLETLLTPRGGNPIGTAIAEGAAFVLGTGYDQRKELKTRIKALYDKRSSVSHGGKTAILSIEVAQLRHITGMLLATLIGRVGEFQSQQGLLDWIERQKLGG